MPDVEYSVRNQNGRFLVPSQPLLAVVHGHVAEAHGWALGEGVFVAVLVVAQFEADELMAVGQADDEVEFLRGKPAAPGLTGIWRTPEHSCMAGAADGRLDRHGLFGEVQVDLAVLHVHGHFAAVGQFAEQQFVGQRRAYGVLDQARHGARAHQGVETVFG